MSKETILLFANEAFYLTFTTRDMEAMDAIWSDRENVTCIHPGWPPLRGRDSVMKSWRNILTNSQSPEIRCERVWPHIIGTMACVLCTEILAEGQLAATNIFVLEDGVWKMIHHHAGPAPSIDPEPTKKPNLLQ